MSLGTELASVFPDHFRVLILDNEVTVDAFVADSPLPWARFTAQSGAYKLAQDYPCPLDTAQSDAEEMNWDQVDLALLTEELRDAADIDLIAIGNNAAQGYPLAAALPRALAEGAGAIIYGSSLPEQSHYETLGFPVFCPRTALLSVLNDRVPAGQPIGLGFINTIQHNDENYHHPWPGR